jgi:hypothetical protein
MLDVHAAHATVHTWKDFFIHIAIITIGLLIAIALEQCVESLHHIHQRHQLQHDLLEEAKRKRDILTGDLGLESQGVWFRNVLAATKSIPADSPPATEAEGGEHPLAAQAAAVIEPPSPIAQAGQQYPVDPALHDGRH